MTVAVNATTTQETTFVQPANSRITAINVITLAAIATAATGVGVQVGVATGGVTKVAAAGTAITNFNAVATPNKIKINL